MASDGDSASDLTEEQTDKLLHFQDVTQIEDLDRCKAILTQHNWNIENAVHSALNVPSSSQPSLNVGENSGSLQTDNNALRNRFQPHTPPHSVLHSSMLPRQMIYVSRRRHRSPQGILGWGIFLFIAPIRYSFFQVFDVLKFVWRLFFPDPRETITDAAGDVRSFIHEFEEKHANHPNFYQGTYADAQEEAKKELKFLLVYLHDPNDDDANQFCMEAFCSQNVVEFINQNMMCWSCSIQKPEGYKVSKALRHPTPPSVIVICLYQRRMTVIARLEGLLSSQELVDKLSQVVVIYEPALVAVRADRETLTQNQQIRQEQDAAYLESLKKDQEKMDQKRKKDEELQRQREEKEKILKEKEMAEELCLQRKERCKAGVGDEPNEKAEDVVTLLMKMPDGSRLKRRFLVTDSVKNVHDYVYAHDESPARFKVFTNFPRRAIPGCSTDEVDDDSCKIPLLKDVGLHRNDSLFIQSLVDDDDDDEDDEGVQDTDQGLVAR